MVDATNEEGKLACMARGPLFIEGSSQLAKQGDIPPEREYTTPDQLKFHRSLDLAPELRRPMMRENLVALIGERHDIPLIKLKTLIIAYSNLQAPEKIPWIMQTIIREAESFL